MSESQSVTKTETEDQKIVQVRSSHFEHLTTFEYDWVSFCAVGGLLVAEDGTITPMTVTTFAQRNKVSTKQLYRMKKRIKDFDKLVRLRRRQLASGSREAKVWNGVFLRAAAGHAKEAEMWLSHFSDYVPPAQRVVHDVNDGIAELLQKRRKELKKQEAISGSTDDSDKRGD